MKAKSTSFYRNKVQPATQRVKQDSAQFLLRHSIIFAKLYERQASKKGAFFAMKAKLTSFYVKNIEPRLKQVKGRVTGWLAAARTGLARFKQRLAGLKAASQARATKFKQQVTGWLARRKRSLWVTAIIIAALATGVGLAYLWQRSPAFRAVARNFGAAALGGLITLGALLKGLRLTLGEGVTGLGQGLPGLGAGALNFLGLVWTRFTHPVIEVVVVTRPAGHPIPVPSVDGRRGA